jgi:lipopolysaccharide cholinephosphotransferase
MVDFQTLFPDEREKGETPLRQCQLVMLRMLKIFDYLCIKYGIKYFLTGGSLLGAVRHQGFIPWDDDLDVGMTRDNYEKFIQYAVPELPKDIFFQNSQTDIYYPPTNPVEARLRDKYSRYNHTNRPNNKWHEGLQVDIFVYDRAFLPHNLLVISFNKVLMIFNDDQKRANVLKIISKLTPFNLVYASKYLKCWGEQGTYITAREYSILTRTKFEDMEVYIPKAFDSYLGRQYGDYMQLPSIEKRISGHNVEGDPFTPCEHTEILNWKDRELSIGNGIK